MAITAPTSPAPSPTFVQVCDAGGTVLEEVPQFLRGQLTLLLQLQLVVWLAVHLAVAGSLPAIQLVVRAVILRHGVSTHQPAQCVR